MQNHAQNLRLLSIFHYVLAGVLVVFACIPLIHLAVGIFMLVAPNEMFGDEAPPQPVRSLFGLMFTVIPLFIIVTGWSAAVLTAIAGRFLMQRRHHTFCLIAAGVQCIFMPLGTVLGVLTILVLVQPEVKEAFGVSDIQGKQLI